MTGKYVRICTKPHEEYRIGITSGVRGEPVKILEDEDVSERGRVRARDLREARA